MLDSPWNQLVRQSQLIVNRNNDVLVVWIEPWADRFELAKDQSIEVVLVGPDAGSAEILPYPGELVIYGWDGSEVAVLRDGRPTGSQAKVAEIVHQEFEIAKDQIRRTEGRLPSEEIELVQNKLELVTEMSQSAQELACELVGHLAFELAAVVNSSNDAAQLIWQIADRIVGKKGLMLAAPSRRSLKDALWKKGPAAVVHLLRNNGISVLPGPTYLVTRGRPASRARPRLSESESGRIPR